MPAPFVAWFILGRADDSVIVELRTAFGNEEVHGIDETLAPGDQVQIGSGPMLGLAAVAGRVMPGPNVLPCC